MIENYLLTKSVSPKSKKIRKSVAKLSLVHKDSESKQYETFGSNQRSLILFDLKKLLLQKEKSIYNLNSEEFIKLLEGLDLEFYRNILAKVLIKHVTSLLFFIKLCRCLQLIHLTKDWPSGGENSKAGSEALKSLKTVISRRAYSHFLLGGSHLVSHSQSEDFKQEIVKILQGLSFRSFPLLQESAVKALEKYRQKDDMLDESESAVCSKHWWFDFLRKYSDVKEMWESLPLEKSYKTGKLSSSKRNPGFSQNTSTAEGSPSTAFLSQSHQPQNELNNDSILSCFDLKSPSYFLQSFHEEENDETQSLSNEFQISTQINEMKEIHLFFK